MNAACPHAQNCELYDKFALKGSLRIWQGRYCADEKRHRTCKRFELASAGKPVPSNMLPNGEALLVL